MKAPAKRSIPPAAPAETARRKVLLVDDHPFMRAGLAQLIDLQPDMRVAGEAEIGRASCRERVFRAV